MGTYSYDVIVIGSGSAGTSVATACQSAGKKVAVMEERDWGGTCVLRGCDAKKVLAGAMEVKNWSKRMEGKGVKEAVSLNWEDLMAFKQTFVEGVPENRLESFQKAGIDTYHATASFLNPNELQVGEHVLSAENIVIATGAKPVMLDIEGKEYMENSDDFLNLPTLPDHITFIGGGYIAFEFAAIANSAGAEVHIIQHNDQPLGGFDEEHVRLLVEQMEQQGINFHFNIDVSRITKEKNGYHVSSEEGFHLNTELVIGSTGRAANIDSSQLDNAQIEYGKKGIKVNEYMQAVGADHIYACGDAADSSGLPLTPVAKLEADTVIENILHSNRKKIHYPAIPSAIFTSPKLAQIGISSKEAAEKPDLYQINDIDTTKWYTYRRTNEPAAQAKVILKKDTQQIAGASFLSEEADVMVNDIAFMMKAGLKANDLDELLFAYPSPASDLSYMVKE